MRAQVLWDNWNKYDDLDQVYRQGFLKIRSYKHISDDKRAISKYSVETTLTHSGRAALLFSDMMDLWPAYFEGVDRYTALKVALSHDIGELVVGDVCDDGRKEHEDKKEAEWDMVVRHYSSFPDETYLSCKNVHYQFEECDTFLGQSLKLADKLDFLAKLIKLESRGYDLKSCYINSLSELDWTFSKDIGSDNFLDIASRHLLEILREENFDVRLRQIAVQFLTCGLQSIGRPFFEWWPQD